MVYALITEPVSAIVNTRWYQDLFPGMRVDSRKDTETEVRKSAGARI